MNLVDLPAVHWIDRASTSDDADLRGRIGKRAASDLRQLFSPASVGSRCLKRLGLRALRARTRR